MGLSKVGSGQNVGFCLSGYVSRAMWTFGHRLLCRPIVYLHDWMLDGLIIVTSRT